MMGATEGSAMLRRPWVKRGIGLALALAVVMALYLVWTDPQRMMRRVKLGMADRDVVRALGSPDMVGQATRTSPPTFMGWQARRGTVMVYYDRYRRVSDFGFVPSGTPTLIDNLRERFRAWLGW
jgi:hypothetical protein